MPSRWEKEGFPLLADELERFRGAVDRSWIACFVVAEFVHSAGDRAIGIGPRVHRPAGGNPADYGDSHDVTITGRSSLSSRRYEVKWRELAFTCCADYPYPTVFVDRSAKADKNDPAGYYIVNQSLTHACFISIVTKPQWKVTEVFDKKKGYPVVLYECPKELAWFCDLREPPGSDAVAQAAKTG